jgi:hypothetical protein
MPRLEGAWSMAKTFAHLFVFHPRSVRVMLFVVRRQLQKICRWLGEYMVKERWLEGPSKSPNSDDAVGAGLTDSFWDFAKYTGAFDPSRIFHAIIQSDVVTAVTRDAGKHAGTLISKSLQGFPIVGGVVAGITSVLVDMTTTTLTDAMKLELEARMWSDDLVANLEMLMKIVNPMECIREMPAYKYHLSKHAVATGSMQ